MTITYLMLRINDDDIFNDKKNMTVTYLIIRKTMTITYLMIRINDDHNIFNDKDKR